MFLHTLPDPALRSAFQNDLEHLRSDVAEGECARTPPRSSDVVIVGGGLSGLLTAYYYIARRCGKSDGGEHPTDAGVAPGSVSVLERWGPGCGASGRNGGHIWPCANVPLDACPLYAQDGDSEMRSAGMLVELIEREGWSEAVRLHRSGGVYCAPAAESSDSTATYACAQFLRPGFALSASRDGAVWQVNGAALCHLLAERLVELGAFVCCGFAVSSVSRSDIDAGKADGGVGEQQGCWAVSGEFEGAECAVSARRVVLALNGFVASVDLPEEAQIATRIEPVRGHVLALQGALAPAIPNVAWEDEEGEQYLIHRRCDGKVVFGGCRLISPSKETPEDDWTVINADIGRALRRQLKRSGIAEAAGVADIDKSVREEWSGIMGFTDTNVPIVEALCGDLFLIGGFSGHGMPRVAAAALYLSTLL